MEDVPALDVVEKRENLFNFTAQQFHLTMTTIYK